ncbi:type III secretion protein HrpX [Ralstonia sp. L16]|uniref:type III secretion protein HrpX n=1 Tax=Ralstonia sp. L16 TaxID=3423950 RepID=UPI003F7A4EE4
MFDHFTLDIIETFDGIQAFAKQEGPKDFGPLNKAIEALKHTAMDMEQRAIRAADVNNREQLRVLSHGFSSAAQVCSGLIPA